MIGFCSDADCNGTDSYKWLDSDNDDVELDAANDDDNKNGDDYDVLDDDNDNGGHIPYHWRLSPLTVEFVLSKQTFNLVKKV